MKKDDDVAIFYWGAVQHGKVVGVFGNNVLIRLRTRNGALSVIKILTPIDKVVTCDQRRTRSDAS